MVEGEDLKDDESVFEKEREEGEGRGRERTELRKDKWYQSKDPRISDLL